MSEPVKAADVIARIFAELEKRGGAEAARNMPFNKLEEIIAEAACPADCPCGKAKA
jgi:hypothetical protein